MSSLIHAKESKDERFRFREMIFKDTKTTMVEITRGKTKVHKKVNSEEKLSPSKFKIRKEKNDNFILFQPSFSDLDQVKHQIQIKNTCVLFPIYQQKKFIGII